MDYLHFMPQKNSLYETDLSPRKEGDLELTGTEGKCAKAFLEKRPKAGEDGIYVECKPVGMFSFKALYASKYIRVQVQDQTGAKRDILVSIASIKKNLQGQNAEKNAVIERIQQDSKANRFKDLEGALFSDERTRSGSSEGGSPKFLDLDAGFISNGQSRSGEIKGLSEYLQTFSGKSPKEVKESLKKIFYPLFLKLQEANAKNFIISPESFSKIEVDSRTGEIKGLDQLEFKQAASGERISQQQGFVGMMRNVTDQITLQGDRVKIEKHGNGSGFEKIVPGWNSVTDQIIDSEEGKSQNSNIANALRLFDR